MANNISAYNAEASLADNIAMYKCGDEVKVGSSNVFKLCYWNGTSPATLTKGDWVHIGVAPSTTYAYNPLVGAVATTAVGTLGGYVTKTLTAAGYVWVQIEGECAYGNVIGHASMAIGSFLQGVTGQAYLGFDSASAKSADSVGQISTAYTTVTAAAKTVRLIRREATIG